MSYTERKSYKRNKRSKRGQQMLTAFCHVFPPRRRTSSSLFAPDWWRRVRRFVNDDSSCILSSCLLIQRSAVAQQVPRYMYVHTRSDGLFARHSDFNFAEYRRRRCFETALHRDLVAGQTRERLGQLFYQLSFLIEYCLPPIDLHLFPFTSKHSPTDCYDALLVQQLMTSAREFFRSSVWLFSFLSLSLSLSSRCLAFRSQSFAANFLNGRKLRVRVKVGPVETGNLKLRPREIMLRDSLWNFLSAWLTNLPALIKVAELVSRTNERQL